MSTISLEIGIILILTLINGLFAMSEVALLSARRVRLQHLAERGNARAEAVLQLLQDPNNFLSTVQVGVTLVGVLSGALGGATLAEQIGEYLGRYPRLAPYGETIGISVVVVVITFLSLVIGELVPKRLALHSPERVASLVVRPMSILSRLGAPLVSVLSASTNGVLSLFRLKAGSEPDVTEDDVRGLLRQGTQAGVFEPMEQQIVERVFRFGDRHVNTIMTPRAEITWLDINDDASAWRTEVLHSLHSRFPVCDADLDHVLGFIEAKDFLLVNDSSAMRSALKPAVVVPEYTVILNVVEQLRQAKAHMALVVDEYGGALGVVTVTDLLEALVGNLPAGISDDAVVQRPDGSWFLDGSLPIHDLNELLHIVELPGEKEGRFQTVAGFVISNLGKIPAAGERFIWDGYRFEVADMDGARIDKILVTPPSRERRGVA